MTAAEDIADRFAAILKRWLTADEFAEMKRLNATADYAEGSCASHDFCDANVAMSEAFTSITGREVNADSGTDTDLWSEAWEIARRKHIGHSVGASPGRRLGGQGARALRYSRSWRLKYRTRNQR
jgi:hypothetical protein